MGFGMDDMEVRDDAMTSSLGRQHFQGALSMSSDNTTRGQGKGDGKQGSSKGGSSKAQIRLTTSRVTTAERRDVKLPIAGARDGRMEKVRAKRRVQEKAREKVKVQAKAKVKAKQQVVRKRQKIRMRALSPRLKQMSECSWPKR